MMAADQSARRRHVPKQNLSRRKKKKSWHGGPLRSRAPGTLDHAVRVVHGVCCLAGSASLLDDIRAELRAEGVHSAIRRHDTGTLFDWLTAALSYQGISDRVASDYMERHGRARWRDIEEAMLGHGATCPKLPSYWHYHGCRYDKTSRTCAEPDHVDRCPLPSHDLRNGRLNQTAYSLYLFIRDVADGDLVGWIDWQLQEADWPHDADRPARLRAALIEPLREVYGVSDKVLTRDVARGRRHHDRHRHVGAQLSAPDRNPGPVWRISFVWSWLLPARRLRRHYWFGGRADRRPGLQSGLPGHFPAVRAARHLAVLRPARPRRLQR
jgi:hypothetical protein